MKNISRTIRQYLLTAIIVIVCVGCQERPDSPPSTPSPRAAENDWPEYEVFQGPYASPGWAGNWDEVPANPIDSENVQTVPLPQCGALNVITAGDASNVQPPNCPGVAPTYQSLCENGYQQVRETCKDLCKRTENTPNPCVNWQVRPHIYEERGCLGGVTPPSTINVPWRRYCSLYEGCVCTFNTQ